MNKLADDGGNLRQAVPFFMVADMDRSVRFYVDGLGFRVTRKWVVDGELRWCLLQRGEAELMIQQHHESWRPAGKVGEGVSICFLCEDALALYAELKARDVESSRPFVGNGLWVTSVADPDGFRLDFESPADAPEETVYAETQRPGAPV